MLLATAVILFSDFYKLLLESIFFVTCGRRSPVPLSSCLTDFIKHFRQTNKNPSLYRWTPCVWKCLKHSASHSAALPYPPLPVCTGPDGPPKMIAFLRSLLTMCSAPDLDTAKICRNRRGLFKPFSFPNSLFLSLSSQAFT